MKFLFFLTMRKRELILELFQITIQYLKCSRLIEAVSIHSYILQHQKVIKLKKKQ